MTDYLAQLMKDKEQLAAFPNVFIHLDRLLDEGLCFLLFIPKKIPDKLVMFKNFRFLNLLNKNLNLNHIQLRNKSNPS